MGSGLIDQIEASIEEAISTDGYSDVMVSLTSQVLLTVYVEILERIFFGIISKIFKFMEILYCSQYIQIAKITYFFKTQNLTLAKNSAYMASWYSPLVLFFYV